MFKKAGAVSATVPAAVGFQMCYVIQGYTQNMLKSGTLKSQSFSASSGEWEKESKWRKGKKSVSPDPNIP